MAINYLASQDPRMAKAEKWVRDNIARDFAIEELANAVALAPRTFARRVSATCPNFANYVVQRIRLETAQFLLETTRLPVEGDCAEGRICGAFHAAPVDPARHETSARTFPSRRVSVFLAPAMLPASVAQYGLHLKIFFESKNPELTPIAGLLVATEGQAAVRTVRR